MSKEIEKKEIKKMTEKETKKIVEKETKKLVEKDTSEVVEKDTKEIVEKDTKKIVKKPATKKGADRYYESQGKRKTSVARVRIWLNKSKGEFVVNGKSLKEYFPIAALQGTALASLKILDLEDTVKVSVLVRGGGLFGQAEAVRHGITRALVDFNVEFRKKLKKAGFLTRDPRMRERKKPGLKRARKSPRWSKR